jgi:hypothetical protein
VKFWIEASRSLIEAAVIALANAVLIFIDWAVLVLRARQAGRQLAIMSGWSYVVIALVAKRMG